MITIEYNNHEYKLNVLETQPSPSAINIVETDLSVDFAPPIGYVEPTAQSGPGSQASNSSSMANINHPTSSMAKDIRQKEDAAKGEAASLRFQAFRGAGVRLSSGADKPSSVRSYASSTADNNEKQSQDISPDDETPVPLDLPIGTLFFGYKLIPPPGSEPTDANDANEEDKFQGEGRVLRQRRKR
ncbi:ubiquitin fusion degradation protein [Coemansia sp. RSA 551]|nr:ubiquitin fusion degradation protein [Coemansia sp. RSA 551]